MSAFVVSKTHIDALLTGATLLSRGAFAPFSWYHNDHLRELHNETASEIGQLLWQENVASVVFRYEEGINSEEFADYLQSVEAYHFTQLMGSPDPVIVLKAICCYEYQSCEHPGWATSEAKTFCSELRDLCVHRLKGFDNAPWEIDDPKVFFATSGTR